MIKKVITTDLFNQYITEQVKPYIDAINITHGIGEGSIQVRTDSAKYPFGTFESNNEYIKVEGEKLVVEIGAAGDFSTDISANSRAEGKRAFTSGSQNYAKGKNATAMGDNTAAYGEASFTEGGGTYAGAQFAHAEGAHTYSNNYATHTEGVATRATTYASHAEGGETKTGESNRHGIVEWISESPKTYTITVPAGKTLAVSSALCNRGTISASVSGNTITVTVDPAPSEENIVLIKVIYTFSSEELVPPTPVVPDDGSGFSHAEGYLTEAFGATAHAEGHTTAAIGQYTHSEGYNTVAFGIASHAQGLICEADGIASFAGGHRTVTSGDYSFAYGSYLTTNAANQVVFGKYNSPDPNAYFIIGNGSGPQNLNTIFTIKNDGVHFGTHTLATQQYVTSSIISSTSTNIYNGTGTGAIVSKTTSTSSTASASFGVALGYRTAANGPAGSIALGYQTTTSGQQPGQTVVGRKNISHDNAMFIVGNGKWNGSSFDESNAFEVLADGTIKLPNFTTETLSVQHGFRRVAIINGVLTVLPE